MSIAQPQNFRDVAAGFKVNVTDASYIPGVRCATWNTRDMGQVREAT